AGMKRRSSCASGSSASSARSSRSLRSSSGDGGLVSAQRQRRVSEPAMPAGWLNGEIAVVGLARSGRAVSTLLARTGAEVYASDSGDGKALEATAAARRNEDVDVQVGAHALQ